MAKKTHELALCGVLCALAVALLWLSGVIPLSTYARPILASATLLPAREECRKSYAWSCFAAAAVLGLLLCADKEAALVFCFLGYYPLVKPNLDAISSKALRLLAKLGLCTVSMGVMYALIIFVFKLPAVVQEFSESATWLLWATAAMGLLLFFVYDLLIDRLAVVYRRRRGKRHKFRFFFVIYLTKMQYESAVFHCGKPRFAVYWFRAVLLTSIPSRLRYSTFYVPLAGNTKRRNVFRRTGGAAVWRPAVKRRAQAAARSCIAEAAGLRFTIMAEVILKKCPKRSTPTPKARRKRRKTRPSKRRTIWRSLTKALSPCRTSTSTWPTKEFIVLVGPSGCGKSTTLRMIAGLEEISGGELFIDGKQMNDVAPKDRDIAMVFQNYALYPHMTVYENIAFPLKLKKIAETDADGKTHLKKMPNDEIDRRVREAAEVLDITQFLDRKPKALSGGQRQRVAIGRAIVRSPKVLLMDEPLSNLDAKLRNQMRAEIIKLREKIDTTFIYVTHDQVEAMTLGDRIVIMRDGYIQQIGTPQEVFNHPANLFVAGFIGSPQMNFFENCQLTKTAGGYTLTVMGETVTLTAEQSAKARRRRRREPQCHRGRAPRAYRARRERHPCRGRRQRADGQRAASAPCREWAGCCGGHSHREY